MTAGCRRPTSPTPVNKAASSAAEAGAPTASPTSICCAPSRPTSSAAKCPPLKGLFTDDTRERLAYHEAGHALVGHWLGVGVVERVTIEPRGKALGVTHIARGNEDPLYKQAELSNRLAMMLGGREAELLVLDSVSSGASDDLKRASALAIDMVGSLGFSQAFGLLSVAGVPKDLLGPDIQAAVLDEARKLLEQAQSVSRQLLMTQRERLDDLARALLASEVLSGGTLRELLGPREFEIEPEPALAD